MSRVPKTQPNMFEFSVESGGDSGGVLSSSSPSRIWWCPGGVPVACGAVVFWWMLSWWSPSGMVSVALCRGSQCWCHSSVPSHLLLFPSNLGGMWRCCVPVAPGAFLVESWGESTVLLAEPRRTWCCRCYSGCSRGRVAVSCGCRHAPQERSFQNGGKSETKH